MNETTITRSASLFVVALLLTCLPVQAQEAELSAPVWHLGPGDRDYLTSLNFGGGYAEQGMAYNLTTGHLYLVHLNGSGLSINILDGKTGDHIGLLSTVGIEGGTRMLRKIGVTADGTIFAGNLSNNTASDPFKLYRWRDEQADPELIWSGDPSNGIADVIRNYGSNIAVRGTGGSTQILIVPDFWQQVTQSHVATLFVSSDGGETFEPDFIITEATSRFGLGTAFGADDTFWGTRAGQPLRQFDFTGTLLREFSGTVVTSGLSPIGIHQEEQILAGIRDSQLWLYDLNTLSTETFNTPIAIRDLPIKNENVERTGEIAFGDDLIYALDTNNGITAFRWGPPLPPEPVEPGDIYWTNASAIRSAEIDGSNPRTVVAGLARPIGIDIHAASSHIYWAEDASSALGGGKIMRSNLDGTGITAILTGRTASQFLKIDPVNLRLYWAEYGTGLYSANLDGSDIRHLIAISGGGTTGVALDLANNFVYLGASSGQLYRFDIGGEFPVTPGPITSLQSGTYGIALNTETNVLWTTTFFGQYLYSKNLTGFLETPLIYGLEQPLGISLSEDNSQLVWVERSFSQNSGRIRTAAVGETTYTTLIEGEDSPFGIVHRPEGPGLGSFASWIGTFGLPLGQTGPGDDPDGDGIPNLLEFALGQSPVIANRGALPQGDITLIGDEIYLTLAVTRNPEAIGIQLVVDVSSDLVTWTSGEDSIVILEESASLLRVRDAFPLKDSSRRFLRVRAIEL